MSRHNLARAFLEAENEDLEEYDGYCLELVDDILHFIGQETCQRAEIMYMDVPRFGSLYPTIADSIRPPPWKYHAVLFLDGLVHDPYLVEAMPVDEYLRTMFPFNDVIEVTYNAGDDEKERVERWIMNNRREYERT